MLFQYKAIDNNNVTRTGTVEATSTDNAITAVQQRGYTVMSIDEIDSESSVLNLKFDLFQRVTNKDLVILSRQISTLFSAQVSALRVFRLLATENANPLLQRILNEIAEDLQSGSSISRALSQHPEVFSSFYVNLVKAGEEAGTLEKSFAYLADYLDRNYQLVSKARNSLIYPAFVIGVFVLVMGLMLTLVIPNIAAILEDAGQELPIYTKFVIGLSDFLTSFIGPILLVLGLGGFALWRFKKSEAGTRLFDELKITVPFIGDLQQKLYLARICDNLATMLASGVSMLDALEVTAEVVDNQVYRDIIKQTIYDVKGGRSFADSLAQFEEIPGVLSQMARVGEESGNLGDILTTMAKFYEREVVNAVDTLIGLIEPAMILLLGLGVGTLLASVLMPIYNMTSAI